MYDAAQKKPASQAYSLAMPDVADSLARALIATHGAGAVMFAEEARRNVRALAMEDRVAEWERVIAAIRAMQKSAS